MKMIKPQVTKSIGLKIGYRREDNKASIDSNDYDDGIYRNDFDDGSHLYDDNSGASVCRPVPA